MLMKPDVASFLSNNNPTATAQSIDQLNAVYAGNFSHKAISNISEFGAKVKSSSTGSR